MDNENQQIEDGLRDSILMLEQILEVMPQDLTALKALYNAYMQCEGRGQAFEYLGMISDIASSSSDVETAQFVMEQLPVFEDDHPAEILLIQERLQDVAGLGVAPLSTLAEPRTEPAAEAEISEELALAWKLYEENQLSQEEYSSVLHDLTEVSSKEVDVPVSVLHVLNDRGFSQMNRIMNYISSRSGVPCISLLNFEFTETIAEVLPLEISARDGALPFAFFGNDLLVAVLNPFNNVLVDKVEKEGGHRCHSYLVSAEEYDIALGKLRKLAA